MRLCEVLGTVTQSAQHAAYEKHKLMLVQAIEPDGQRSGRSFLAIDNAQAGEGDRVLVLTEGNGVRQILKKEQLPIRSLIVGIVDSVSEMQDQA